MSRFQYYDEVELTGRILMSLNVHVTWRLIYMFLYA